MRPRSSVLVLLTLLAGCASEPLASDDRAKGGASSTGGTDARGPEVEGLTLDVPVSADTRAYVDLAPPRVVDTEATSADWDLAFQGYGVYTNGGSSGVGRGSAFGPLSLPTFLSDTAPEVPLVVDEPGGAFLRWYAYDDDHVLLSRFHVYALRDGERFYKLQILSYYGTRAGAPVSALYALRFAAVTPSGVSRTTVVTELDATATSEESECLNLETGERSRLSLSESARNMDWHLCFRRDGIRVNGGDAGPRGVAVADLHEAETDTERLVDVRARSAESELARFDEVDFPAVSDPNVSFRYDGITSAFTGLWSERTDPPTPKDAVWLVVGADGARYLLRFDGFTGATSSAPGTVHLRVKAVR